MMNYTSHAQVVNKSDITEEMKGKKYIIHLVQPGETLLSLSELYGVSVNSIIKSNTILRENTPKPNQIIKIPTASIGELDRNEQIENDSVKGIVEKKNIVVDTLDTSRYRYYFVKKKETLYAIAKKFNITIKEIKDNNSDLGSILHVNQRLIIPLKSSVKEVVVEKPLPVKETQFRGQDFSYYTVHKKETIYSLCKRFGISKSLLFYMNPDLKKSGLIANAKIRIPHQDIEIKNVEINNDLVVEGSQNEINTVRHYKVKFFETIQGISKRERVSLETIYKMNPGVRSQGVSWGDVIILPRIARIEKEVYSIENKQTGKVKDTSKLFITHHVKKSETLYAISKLYDVDLQDLYKNNDGLTVNVFKGQEIRIPLKQRKKSDVDNPSVINTTAVELEGESIDDENSEMDFCYRKEFNENTIKVALMIPLFLDDSVQISNDGKIPKANDYRSFNFIQFYEGAMCAIDTLKKQGIHADIKIFDVTNNVEQAYNAINDIDDVDIIIGPIYAEPFKIVAQYASEKGIPVVNPLSSRKEIIETNSNIYKVTSSMKSELKAMAKYINNNYPDSTNVFIVRNNWYWHEDAFAYLKEQLADVNNGADINYKNIVDIAYQKDSLKPMTADSNYFVKQNVVIGLTENKVFSLELMRHLNELKDSVNIVSVFGLSKWQNYNIDNRFRMSLDLHLFSSEYIDYSAKETKWFIRDFRRKYKTEPVRNKYAFKGYDVTYYFLSALYRYGNDFDRCLKYHDVNTIETHMSFEENEYENYENYYMQGLRYYKFKLQTIKKE